MPWNRLSLTVGQLQDILCLLSLLPYEVEQEYLLPTNRNIFRLKIIINIYAHRTFGKSLTCPFDATTLYDFRNFWIVLALAGDSTITKFADIPQNTLTFKYYIVIYCFLSPINLLFHKTIIHHTLFRFAAQAWKIRFSSSIHFVLFDKLCFSIQIS